MWVLGMLISGWRQEEFGTASLRFLERYAEERLVDNWLVDIAA